MSRFNHRSEEKEMMDDLECSGEELEQTLRELKTINRLLGGNYVTTSGLAKLFHAKPQESYTVADIGCGGGDMIRIMHEWALSNKKKVKFIGVDANPNIIRIAKERLIDLPDVRWKIQNVFHSEFALDPVDVVTCTLFTHHFTDPELVALLTAFRQKAKIGIVINDLHRHPLAYHSIKLLTKWFSRSPMVQNDAPVSVLRSFSKQDWKRILEEAGIENFKIRWNWAFRWQVYVLF
jgi:ubiquinone/menaquinone biosynthesis C-methylase UbiE